MTEPWHEALVEKVAQAIYEYDFWGDTAPKWPTMTDIQKEPFRKRARHYLDASGLREAQQEIASLRCRECSACGGPFPNENCGHLKNARDCGTQAPCAPAAGAERDALRDMLAQAADVMEWTVRRLGSSRSHCELDGTIKRIRKLLEGGNG